MKRKKNLKQLPSTHAIIAIMVTALKMKMQRDTPNQTKLHKKTLDKNARQSKSLAPHLLHPGCISFA